MFAYKGNNSIIKKSVSMANDGSLLNHVCKEIKKQGTYDMSNYPPEKIHSDYFMFMMGTTIEVKEYRNRFTRAMGYFTKSRPNEINVNMSKHWNNVRMVSLFYHESGHSFDFFYPDYSIHHGYNNPKGKENTFQYSLNRYVYDFFGYKKPKRVSFWARIKRGIFFWR